MSRRPSLRAAILAIAAALAPHRAAAQPYDPSYRWRTVETPHFRIHFHQGEDALAQEVARTSERAFAALVPVLGWTPRERTEVVLSDDVDLANGSATPLPYDTIRLYASPPESLSELNGFRDWISTLVFHEYVHILHLDHVRGFPAGFNAVFGKLWVPNGLVPAWMIEGLAVLHEGDGDGSPGRNGNAIFDMYLRAMATEGAGLPPLDVLSNPMLEWPRGASPYLLGGRFVGFLEARYGAAAVAGFVAQQGGMVWPWAPSWAGSRWFGGKDFPTLWDEFRAEVTARAGAELAAVRARPVTRATPLTRLGGSVQNPRWSPDGASIVYMATPLDVRPGLFRAGPAGEDLGRAATIWENGTFALRSPREAIVAAGEIWHEFRLYGDLVLVDLDTGAERALTDGERATDPDVAPDGASVVYVAHEPGTLVLRRRALRGAGRSTALGPAETLLARPGALVWLPRVSPDGRRVAFELHEHGRRDIALWEDGRVVKVTDDEAVDLSPAWTPDGRYLLFASDRSGLYDLYAWEAATGVVRQVTNVETGALQPTVSPDGRTIAFLTYSRAGYDLAAIPLDPATWTDLPAPEAAAATTSVAPIPFVALPVAAPPPPESAGPALPDAALPSRPYRALDTLGPTFWLPIVTFDPRGLALGALTGGQDVLALHTWALEGWWGVVSGQPGYAVSYLGGWSWPRVDLSSARTVEISPGPPDRLQSVWTIADAGLDFTFTKLERAAAVRVGWAGTQFHSLEAWSPAAAPPDVLFEDGFLSSASLSLAYSDARRFARSISFEEGKTLELRLAFAGRETGSDFDLASARVAWAGYLRVPGTRHVVLATRLSGGIARGTVGGHAPYELGGPARLGGNLLFVLGAGTPTQELRGYAPGAFEGNAFALANVELRFPLFAPELGRSTWPLFLRRVHGAVFVDAGQAFETTDQPYASEPFRWDRTRFGAGAEVVLETYLGYYLPLEVRVGVARGLGPLLAWSGGWPSDPEAVTQVYVSVGASF